MDARGVAKGRRGVFVRPPRPRGGSPPWGFALVKRRLPHPPRFLASPPPLRPRGQGSADRYHCSPSPGRKRGLARRPDLAFGRPLRPAPVPPRAQEAPFADRCRGREAALQRSRKAAEDAPERCRRIPTARRLRKEPKGLPTLGLPSPSEKARSFPSGRPAGLLEAAAAPCWMLCSLSEENPLASPEPRYREGRRFPRGGG